MNPDAGGRWRRLRRASAVAAVLVVAGTLLWWAVGRMTAQGRRVTIRHTVVTASPDSGRAGDTTAPEVDPAPGEGAGAAPVRREPEARPEEAPGDAGGAGELRVVAWNIAHGRGDDTTGWFANWTADAAERRERLLRVAAVLRRADADVVVLNEVDFDATWSGGVDQAAVVARAAGYPTWVEQRNFDLHLPFLTFAFGNAVLSRLPVSEARWLELPVRSHLESLAAGAKAAATVRIRGARGVLTVVPVHLEFRPGPTRRAAVSVFDSVRAAGEGPVVLAGDFNAAPPGWPDATGPTVLGALLDAGWTSPRARGVPSDEERTWPTKAPRRALDWILVEPPLEVVEARVLEGEAGLSDHAPVLSVIRLPPG